VARTTSRRTASDAHKRAGTAGEAGCAGRGTSTRATRREVRATDGAQGGSLRWGGSPHLRIGIERRVGRRDQTGSRPVRRREAPRPLSCRAGASRCAARLQRDGRLLSPRGGPRTAQTPREGVTLAWRRNQCVDLGCWLGRTVSRGGVARSRIGLPHPHSSRPPGQPLTRAGTMVKVCPRRAPTDVPARATGRPDTTVDAPRP